MHLKVIGHSEINSFSQNLIKFKPLMTMYMVWMDGVNSQRFPLSNFALLATYMWYSLLGWTWGLSAWKASPAWTDTCFEQWRNNYKCFVSVEIGMN